MNDLFRVEELIFLSDAMLDIRMNGSTDDANIAKAIQWKLEKLIEQKTS